MTGSDGDADRSAADGRDADPDPTDGTREPTGSLPSRDGGGAGRTDDRSGTDRRDAPFAALSAELADRERRRADADDPFESMPVPEFDGDPWADLGGEGADSFAGDAVRVGGAAGDRAEHVVSKRGYCQQCPHVSDPPALSCTYEEGEIVEVLDDGMVRVRGCPMVDDADAGDG